MCLQLEMGCFGIIKDLVAFGADGALDVFFEIEVGLVRGVSHLGQEGPLVRPYGIEKDGIRHAGLDVQVTLGNGGMHGGAVGQDDQQDSQGSALNNAL